MNKFGAREQNEIVRSAAEAKTITLGPTGIDRYLNPPQDSAYSLEYAYYLLGMSVLDSAVAGRKYHYPKLDSAP